jgi:hypothetical protein
MTIAVSLLEQDRQQPQDVAALLADFLAAARSSLHLAVYDFRLSGPAAGLVLGALRDVLKEIKRIHGVNNDVVVSAHDQGGLLDIL